MCTLNCCRHFNCAGSRGMDESALMLAIRPAPFHVVGRRLRAQVGSVVMPWVVQVANETSHCLLNNAYVASS